MRIIILSFILFSLTACEQAKNSQKPQEPKKTSVRYFDIVFAENDNQFSVKKPFTITAILPYNIQWSLTGSSTENCAELSRIRGDAYKITPIRQQLENCIVELNGSVVNSYGEKVANISQNVTIQQATPKNTNAAWLSGSWGLRFAIPGGVELTKSDANWVEGAQDIVSQLSSYDYVMLNLTANARGFRYLLRENANIDIANEIHPDLVPSAEKDNVLLDVINIFKTNNKKVILYLAADGPAGYMLQRHGHSDPEQLAAWENYYELKHNGDEGAAWRTLLEGFLVRLRGKVDGFWIDHVDHMPGEVDKLITLIKEVDPNFVVGLNRGKNYIKGEDGNYLKVAADKNGTVEKPYQVVSLTPLEAYSDFTSGHPTPLAYGAKPNSWAYEEFTFSEVEQAPWVFTFEKPVVRHWFGPMRSNWQRGDLLFEPEQAYRFVRRITDAGGAITWATTVKDGRMAAGDLAILKVIDERLASKEMPPYEAYKRPSGAKLLD